MMVYSLFIQIETKYMYMCSSCCPPFQPLGLNTFTSCHQVKYLKLKSTCTTMFDTFVQATSLMSKLRYLLVYSQPLQIEHWVIPYPADRDHSHVYANNLGPDETPRNSGSHPDPRCV